MKSLPFIILISTGVLAAQSRGPQKRQGEKPQPHLNHKKGDRKPPRPADFIKHHDQDEDGKVSRAEFDASDRVSRLEEKQRTKIFRRLDKNEDGFITAEDLKKIEHPKRHDFQKNLDSNKDGKITREEFSKAPHLAKMSEDERKKIFDRLDRDKNGFLDRRDRPRRPKGPRGRRPELKLESLDLDKDEAISWEEFQKAPAVIAMPAERRRAFFDQLDKDHDGELKAKELRHPRPGRPDRPKKPGR